MELAVLRRLKTVPCAAWLQLIWLKEKWIQDEGNLPTLNDFSLLSTESRSRICVDVRLFITVTATLYFQPFLLSVSTPLLSPSPAAQFHLPNKVLNFNVTARFVFSPSGDAV